MPKDKSTTATKETTRLNTRHGTDTRPTQMLPRQQHTPTHTHPPRTQTRAAAATAKTHLHTNE